MSTEKYVVDPEMLVAGNTFSSSSKIFVVDAEVFICVLTQHYKGIILLIYQVGN